MKYTNNRSGIALIIVLGFLAIMLVMGLAFSVSMRTERLASEVSRDYMQVGQIMRGALTDARDYLNDTYIGIGSVSSPEFYALTNALLESQALSGDPQTKLGSAIDLCGGEASEWIPAKFLNGGSYKFDAIGRANNIAEWILVRDPAPGTDNRILGRYGYLMIDCSGQLDANVVDDAVYPRKDGTNSIKELRINNLPEVMTPTSFKDNRKFFNLFGTFPEIMLLNDGVLPSYTCYTEEKSALNPNLLNNFCSYSCCYDRGWWNGSAWQSYLDATSLSATEFENEFGYDSIVAANLADALADFQDTDSDPVNTPATDPSFEAVPMINEMIISNTLAGSVAATFTHNIKISVEIWYPFEANPDNNDYFLRLTGLSATSDKLTYSTATGDVTVALVPTTFGQVSADFVPPSDANTVMWEDVFLTQTYVDPAALPGSWAYQCRIEQPVVQLVRKSSGVVVDQVTPPNVLLRFLANSALGVTGRRSMKPDSVTDPRANHDPNNWIQNNLTENAVNDNLASYFNISKNGMYEGLDMYVKNAALESVDEVGYLFTGEPWTSIDLFGSNGVCILQKARVPANIPTAKVYTNGLVNPNSQYGEVLRTVFEDVPMDPVPYTGATPTTNILDDVSAQSYLTSAIMTVSSASPWSNSYSWVTNAAFQPGGALEPATKDDPFFNQQKDAIIRNCYRLFNAQQNLHTIIVVAQGINDQGTIGEWEENIDVITGEKRAVAVVWRDPFPDANGNYEVLIRQFKYLDE